ncbi:ZIP family metal transporter [Halobaculum sp. MBLA0147]|uniref:ZIP family metal transporter n=1 Tax=Halobaculum sp. MBLA0147 TaxID=3079934 RepID=UPI003525449B
MVTPGSVALVFFAGLATALATGLGAVPFFFIKEIGDRWNIVLWGLASGIMLAASGFGLVVEGLNASTGLPVLLVAGVAAGVALVVAADAVIERVDLDGLSTTPQPSEADVTTKETPQTRTNSSEVEEETQLISTAVTEGDLRKLLLIFGILTIHSFPEGVAVGVSFADVGLDGGLPLFGVTVPLLAVFMTVAISIHNIPEGVAVSIPLRSMGVDNWRLVAAAVFSSLPQPIGAAVAFLFVSWARAFLPFGFGFAAGAMVFLVVSEFLPEALELGENLDNGGFRELAGGTIAGVLLMLPLLMF